MCSVQNSTMRFLNCQSYSGSTDTKVRKINVPVFQNFFTIKAITESKVNSYGKKFPTKSRHKNVTFDA